MPRDSITGIMTSPDTEASEALPGIVRYEADLSHRPVNDSARRMEALYGEGLFAATGEAGLLGALRLAFTTGCEQSTMLHGPGGRAGAAWMIEVALSPERDANGVRSVIGVAIDRTLQLRREAELRKAELRLRLALTGSNDGWWDWDITADRVHYSDRWWEMLGYQENDLPADSGLWRILCHPEDLGQVEQALRTTREAGERGLVIECRLRHKQGHYVTVSSRAAYTRDGDGRAVRLSGTSQDVTERRKVESALRESEQHLRQLFNSLVLGFSLHEVICDAQGKPVDYVFIDVNPSFETLTGLKRENLVGRRVLEVLPNTEPYWIERFGQVAITGKTARFHDFSREFGRHYEVVCYCPKPGKFAVLSLDITDRIRFEEAVRQREMRFMRLIENASDLITIVDSSGAVVYQSPSIERVLGYAASEILGRRLADLVHPDDSQKTAAGLLAALGNPPEPSRMSFRVRNQAGAWREISAVGMGIGEERQVVVNARDVTDEHQLAAQLRQSQKMEAIGQLAGGIAHDFNNLLTAITGYGSLLQQGGALSAEDADNVGQILEAANRAARLTQQLLAFSRLQAITLRIIDLNEVVSNLSRMLARLLGETIRVELDLERGTIGLEADVGMVEQVLVNLAVNSRDAMPAGGRLRIGTSTAELDAARARAIEGGRPGRFAVLSVSDTGSGIDPEVLPHIFEPFFTTKGVGKGTGLGLPTVLGIVQQHQGWISVSTGIGKGTRFDLYLPMASSDAERPAQSVPAHAYAAKGGSETLLIAEDDPSVRQFLKRCLAKLGYEALVASDGDEALRIWRRHSESIRLLLTDVVMPGSLGGWELSREILAERPGLPVVYASGYNADAEGRMVTPMPDTLMLRKPFSAEELAVMLRRALDGARAAV